MFGTENSSNKRSSSRVFSRVSLSIRPSSISLKATKNGIEMKFTSPLEKNQSINTKSYQIKVWDLKRTRNYGSRHYNERLLEINEVVVSEDNTMVRLIIPELKPTWGMSIKYKLTTENGEEFQGEINNSIHKMPQT